MTNRLKMERIETAFFQRDPVVCARELIGAHFLWNGCTGRIVETEAYRSDNDPACHTWFRPSARDFVAAHPAGVAYVYLNYGVHWLFNVLVKSGEGSGFVLFRAVEPVAGLDDMRARRTGVAHRDLGSGPGKLTRAMGIDGAAHGKRFLESDRCGIFGGSPVATVSGGRIGISRAADLPWRFGDAASGSLSRKF